MTALPSALAVSYVNRAEIPAIGRNLLHADFARGPTGAMQRGDAESAEEDGEEGLRKDHEDAKSAKREINFLCDLCVFAIFARVDLGTAQEQF
jgi:hypothetical protein